LTEVVCAPWSPPPPCAGEDVVGATTTLVDGSATVLFDESPLSACGAGRAFAPTRRTAAMVRMLRRKYMA
jgi:hypothetical protein